MVVEMAPKTRTARGKEPVEEVSDTASNVGETAQGELLLAIQNVMKEITLHRTEMVAERNADSERWSEQVSSRQTKPTSSHQLGLSPLTRPSLIPPARLRLPHPPLSLRRPIGQEG